MPFYHLPEIAFQKIREGVSAKIITGEKMQMCLIRLEPGQKTNHHHPNEQMGYILSGKVALTIGDETKVCGVGDAYYIPANLQHGFEVLSDQDLEYVEIFSPPKIEE